MRELISLDPTRFISRGQFFPCSFSSSIGAVFTSAPYPINWSRTFTFRGVGAASIAAPVFTVFTAPNDRFNFHPSSDHLSFFFISFALLFPFVYSDLIWYSSCCNTRLPSNAMVHSMILKSLFLLQWLLKPFRLILFSRNDVSTWNVIQCLIK